MNFRRGRERENLDLNLIPFIDVLLVIIIFLMMTTTYAKYSGLEINLPTSDASPTQEQPNEINVAVTAEGDITIDRTPVGTHNVDDLVIALRRAAPDDKGGKAPVVVINADAKANFQSVVDVMQAAQKAGLPAVSFATQSGGKK